MPEMFTSTADTLGGSLVELEPRIWCEQRSVAYHCQLFPLILPLALAKQKMYMRAVRTIPNKVGPGHADSRRPDRSHLDECPGDDRRD
jgi:hypothetical protein